MIFIQKYRLSLSLIITLLIISNFYVNAQTDDCVGATPLTVGTECEYQTFTNVGTGFTDSTFDAPCGASDAVEQYDFWFSFTATSSTTIINAIAASFTQDIVLSIVDDCTLLNSLACADFLVNNEYESIQLATSPGTTYYIHGFDDDGDIINQLDICVTSPPTCVGGPSDDCSSATLLDQNEPFCGSFTSGAYTLDPSDPAFSCVDGGFPAWQGSAWYQFEAQESTAIFEWGLYSAVNSDCSQGVQYEIFSGTCGSLTSIASNCTTGEGGFYGTETIAGLTVGETYYIYMDRFALSECDFFIQPIDGIVDCGPSGFIPN